MPSVTTAREMRHRLIAKFGGTTQTMLVPEHLMLFEVRIDGPPRFPGMRVERDPKVTRHRLLKQQRIDAVAVGIWARTEHLIHGFEIKVSRADLLSELRNPEKSAAGIAACDRWWLVLGDAKLLKDGDDIPDSWGILAPYGRGLSVIQAPKPNHDAVQDGRFIAAMMQAELRSPRYRYGIGFRAGYERAQRYWEGRAQAWGREQRQHIEAGCQLVDTTWRDRL